MLIPGPMVKIFEKAFAFNKHEDDSGIQTMKGEMIKPLETRFDDVEESELQVVFTCLDPRLRKIFFSKDAKRLARKYVFETVVDTDVEVEPQSKRPHTESSSGSAADNTSSKFENAL